MGQDFIWFDQRVEETSAEQGSFPETLLSSQSIRQVREVEILSVHTEPLLSCNARGTSGRKPPGHLSDKGSSVSFEREELAMVFR